MIRTVLLGMSRLVFNAAIVAVTLALVLGYMSVRLAKAAMKPDNPKPVRDAGFATLIAAVALARAIGATRTERTPSAEVADLQERP